MGGGSGFRDKTREAGQSAGEPFTNVKDAFRLDQEEGAASSSGEPPLREVHLDFAFIHFIAQCVSKARGGSKAERDENYCKQAVSALSRSLMTTRSDTPRTGSLYVQCADPNSMCGSRARCVVLGPLPVFS